MTPRILKGLYHFAIYAVGTLVLLTAVTITIIRLLLPDVGSYRSEIETWVSSYMDLPIEFHFVDSIWHGWTPELTLTDITIWNEAGTQAITHFDRFTIRIAPLATLVERQFIPKSLLISGFELSVIHHENGSISAQDIKLGANEKEASGQNELAEWLLKQDEVEIQNAEIVWTDIKNLEKPRLFTDVTFKLRNDVGRLQIDGSASLPNKNESKMDFAFDAFGNLLTSDWSGELYLSGNNINPDNWYKKHRPLDFDTTGGLADLKVWSSWKQSKLSKLEGELQYKNFDALIGSKSIQVYKLTYNFLGKRDDNDGWQFQIDLENFQTENGVWPTTELSITAEPTAVTNTYRYTANYDFLKIGDLAPLLTTTAFLPEQAKKFLNELSIEGELRNGKLVYDPSREIAGQVSYETEFVSLSTDLGINLPSFSNLSGRIVGTQTQGTVSLQNKNSTLRISTKERNDIELTRLVGEVHWRKNNSTWALNTKRLEIENNDLSAIILGGVSKNNAQESPFVDLIVELDQSRLELIADYLHGARLVRLKEWMKRALLAGTVKSAGALFRGHLQDFPFDSNNGRFEIIADIEDVTVDYSAKWPPADKLNGGLILSGRQLVVNINNGMIFNTDITNAKAAIPDILAKRKILEVDGHINGIVKDLSLFVVQSPLRGNQNIHEASKALNKGNFGLNLKLDILLGKQKGEKPDINVDGEINFANVMLKSTSISVSDLEGDFSFTKNSGSINKARGTYYSTPVSLSMQYLKSDKENPASITLSGIGDSQFIVDRIVQYAPYVSDFHDELITRISGETPWQVKLSYPQNEDNTGITKLFEVTSNFNGLAIDLPPPFRKTIDEISPIKLSYKSSLLSNNQTLEIEYDSDVHIKLDLDKTAKDKLQLARVFVGEDLLTTDSEHGFFVGGSMDYLSIKEWIETIKPILVEGRSSHPLLNDLEIDLQLSKLNLFNHINTDVKALAQKDDNGWIISLNGEDIKGDIILPGKIDRYSRVVLQLEKLHLNERSDFSTDNETNPTDLPAFLVNVDDFNYYDRELGQLQLQTSPARNGISIDYFNFYKPALNIEGQGEWLVSENVQRSNFKITLQADDLDVMLDTLDYELASIKSSQADMQIDASWQGSPMEFDMQDLNGKIDLQISKGQLLDIEPSAGRLFGLLSIQALPRRLFLDFSDLFSKGLVFDSIAGSFDIDKGNAYTNNLYMKAPFADIAISGRTGLAKHDYDQLVTVTPQVSGTLPIAGGAVFGPVGIGVGAAIYLVGKMFKSISNDKDNILSRQYTITGNWDSPVVEKIKNRDMVTDGS